MSTCGGRPVARCVSRWGYSRCMGGDRSRPLPQPASYLWERRMYSTRVPQHFYDWRQNAQFHRGKNRGDIRILDFGHPRRKFSNSAAVSHGHLTPPKPGEELHVTFVDKEGDEHTFEVAKGDNLLDIAQANDLEMEGACGGSCACSTCHVVVDDQDTYEKIPEPDDDENDMLDLAFGLTETSRLGCQVKMDPDIEGMKVKLPSMTRNLQQSDFSKN